MGCNAARRDNWGERRLSYVHKKGYVIAMCNAWNHSHDCTCGWGGEGHLGRGGGSWRAETTWGGGTDLNAPNALCPVCGDSVFFIRPRNGGSLWLNAMGPPWPKHPCMDSARLRSQHPIPSSVPQFAVLPSRVEGWDTVYSEVTSSYSEADGAWSLFVGHERLLVARKPLEAISPVYIRTSSARKPYGQLEYLGDLNGAISNVQLDTCDRVLRSLSRLGNPKYPPTNVEDDWAILEAFVVQRFEVNSSEAQVLIDEIRKECDWLLDAGWQWSNSGPTLVKARVARACQAHDGVDADLVYRWMELFI